MKLFQTEREQMQFMKGGLICTWAMICIVIALSQIRGWE